MNEIFGLIHKLQHFGLVASYCLIGVVAAIFLWIILDYHINKGAPPPLAPSSPLVTEAVKARFDGFVEVRGVGLHQDVFGAKNPGFRLVRYYARETAVPRKGIVSRVAGERRTNARKIRVLIQHKGEWCACGYLTPRDAKTVGYDGSNSIRVSVRLYDERGGGGIGAIVSAPV